MSLFIEAECPFRASLPYHISSFLSYTHIGTYSLFCSFFFPSLWPSILLSLIFLQAKGKRLKRRLDSFSLFAARGSYLLGAPISSSNDPVGVIYIFILAIPLPFLELYLDLPPFFIESGSSFFLPNLSSLQTTALFAALSSSPSPPPISVSSAVLKSIGVISSTIPLHVLSLILSSHFLFF